MSDDLRFDPGGFNPPVTIRYSSSDGGSTISMEIREWRSVPITVTDWKFKWWYRLWLFFNWRLKRSVVKGWKPIEVKNGRS